MEHTSGVAIKWLPLTRRRSRPSLYWCEATDISLEREELIGRVWRDTIVERAILTSYPYAAKGFGVTISRHKYIEM